MSFAGKFCGSVLFSMLLDFLYTSGKKREWPDGYNISTEDIYLYGMVNILGTSPLETRMRAGHWFSLEVGWPDHLFHLNHWECVPTIGMHWVGLE